MEDFNGDNQKLEAALASLAAADTTEQQTRAAQDAAIRQEASAAAEAVPLVKLLEVPVTQEAAQVDVDVYVNASGAVSQTIPTNLMPNLGSGVYVVRYGSTSTVITVS